MGGSAGTSAALAQQNNPGLAALNAQQSATNNPGLQGLLSQYASGGIDLNSALSKAGSLPGQTIDPAASQRASINKSLDDANNLANSQNPMERQVGQQLQGQLHGQLDALPQATQGGTAFNQQALSNAIATDPMAGSLYAKSQVMSDPTLKGLFGDNGMQGQAEQGYTTAGNNLGQDRNAMMGRDESYGLKDSDLAAYGQASGNIARQFGNQEQGLSQMLASRGLDQGPNGVAASKFSGLYGNKAEQLAGLQQNIAQQRINTAKDLAQTRTNQDLQEQAQSGALASQLGQLGQSSINNQFNRQLAGAENQTNQQLANANTNMSNQAMNQNANNEAFAQQQATKTPDFGTALGGAVAGGLGGALGSIGGALGGRAGNSLGKKLFG